MPLSCLLNTILTNSKQAIMCFFSPWKQVHPAVNSVRMIVGHLPHQIPSCVVTQFVQTTPTQWRILVVSDLIKCFTTFLLQRMHSIPWTSRIGFCSDMQCELRDLTQACALLHYVKSIQFATGRPPVLDRSQV